MAKDRSEYQRQWYQKNKDRVYAKNKIWKKNNRDKVLEHKKIQRVKSRNQCLQAYSLTDPPSCECCGESHNEFLTIDHAYGKGNKHRLEGFKGVRFYRFLVSQHFPAGYRILCMNCNHSLGTRGYCPHGNCETIKTADDISPDPGKPIDTSDQLSLFS